MRCSAERPQLFSNSFSRTNLDRCSESAPLNSPARPEIKEWKARFPAMVPAGIVSWFPVCILRAVSHRGSRLPRLTKLPSCQRIVSYSEPHLFLEVTQKKKILLKIMHRRAGNLQLRPGKQDRILHEGRDMFHAFQTNSRFKYWMLFEAMISGPSSKLNTSTDMYPL